MMALITEKIVGFGMLIGFILLATCLVIKLFSYSKEVEVED